jgi:hypothetical protein
MCCCVVQLVNPLLHHASQNICKSCLCHLSQKELLQKSMEQGSLVSHPIDEVFRQIKREGADKPCYSECWFQVHQQWNFDYLLQKVGEQTVKVARDMPPNPMV